MNCHPPSPPNTFVTVVTSKQSTTGMSNGASIISTQDTKTVGVDLDSNQPSTSGDSTPQTAPVTSYIAAQDTQKTRTAPEIQYLKSQTTHTASNILYETEQKENENAERAIPIPNIYETINIEMTKDLPEYIQLPEVKNYQELENYAYFPKIRAQFLNDIQELKKIIPDFIEHKFDNKIDTFYKNIQTSYNGTTQHLLPLYKETTLDLRYLIVKLKRYQNEYQQYDTDSKQKDYISYVLHSCLEDIDLCPAGIHGRFRLSYFDLEASEAGLAGKIIIAKQTLLHELTNSFLFKCQQSGVDIPPDIEFHLSISMRNLVCDDLNIPPIDDPFATKKKDMPDGLIKKFRSAAQFYISRRAIIQELSNQWSNEFSTLLQQKGLSTWETNVIPFSELNPEIIEYFDNRLFQSFSSWLGKTGKEALNLWTLIDEKGTGSYSLLRHTEKLFAWVALHFRGSKDNPISEPKVTVVSSVSDTTNPNLHIGTIGGAFFWIFNDEQPLEAGQPCTYKPDNHITLELSHLTPEQFPKEPEVNYALLTQAMTQTNKAEDIASFFMNPDISKELCETMPWLIQTLSNQLTYKLAHNGNEFKTTLCQCVCDQVVNSKDNVVSPEVMSWLINTPLLELILLKLQLLEIDITPITQFLTSRHIPDFSVESIKQLLTPEDCHRLFTQACSIDQIKTASNLLLTGHCDELIHLLGITPMSVFASRGIVSGLEYLLGKSYIDANETNTLGYTPLMSAARNGCTECIIALLAKNGIQVNKRTKQHSTALQLAAKYGHLDIVMLLLAADGIDVNLQDEAGWSALTFAASEGHIKCVEVILNVVGVDVNAKNKKGCTALHLTVLQGQTECMEMLLASPKTDVNLRDNLGLTPLIIAVNNGDVIYTQKLLDANGIDVNAHDMAGYTALHYAARKDYVGCLRKLLDSTNINTNARNNFNMTPLFCAATEGNIECIKMLLNSPETDANVADIQGWTPMLIAASNWQPESIEALLTSPHIDVNMPNDLAWTPLNYAASQNVWECVEAILASPHTDVNAPNIHGCTPLNSAATNGHVESLKKILAAPSINIHTPDNTDYTPLDNATKNGHVNCTKELLDKAYPNSDHNKAVSKALGIALKYHQKNCWNLLLEYMVPVSSKQEEPDYANE